MNAKSQPIVCFLFATAVLLFSACFQDFTLAPTDGGSTEIDDIIVDTVEDTNTVTDLDTTDTGSQTESDHETESQPESDSEDSDSAEKDTEDTTTQKDTTDEPDSENDLPSDEETETKDEPDTATETASDTATEEPAHIIYVDGSSLAKKPDGLSWSTAFKSVQQGIEMAFLRGAGFEEWQVWVAAGVYPVYQSAATDAITLKKKVHVYGGFIGTETALEARNYRANETTLDGEGKVFHVVLGEDDAVIDGFTVRGGNADGAEASGGGIYCAFRSPIIRNCTITGNKALYGGGIATKQSAARIENCHIVGNSAGRGGGLYINSDLDGQPPKIINTVFAGNTGSVHGGAAYVWESNPFFVNCTIVDNNAQGNGGGLCGYENSSLFVKNTVIWANAAAEAGNQYHMNYTSSVTFLYCNIQDYGVDEVSGCTDGDPNLGRTEAPYDLRIRPPSAAIDTGTNIDAPSTDIEGNPRPQGFGFDMGAYEYSPV